jgi:hypothetical protein
MFIKRTETEKEVLKIIKSRWKIGRERYKQGISYKQNPNPEAWLNEAIEEAADLLQYLTAMRLRMRKIK